MDCAAARLKPPAVALLIKLRRETFLKGTASRTGVKDVSWLHMRGGEMSQNDWQDGNLRTLGVLFGNRNNTAHHLLFLLNAADEPVDFNVPAAGAVLGLAVAAAWLVATLGSTPPAAGRAGTEAAATESAAPLPVITPLTVAGEHPPIAADEKREQEAEKQR